MTDHYMDHYIKTETVTIKRRTWERTCQALAEAEQENVQLKRRLRRWDDLQSENGWVDAEAVNESEAS